MLGHVERPRRVAITGMGCVTPIGVGREAFWRNLVAGESGVRTIESFELGDSPVRIAAEVRDFDAPAQLNVKDRKHVPRTVPLALAAAREALGEFGPRFGAAYLGGLRRKIGLSTEREGDDALAQDLLARMAEGGADFTNTFRRLCDAAAGPDGDAAVRALFARGEAYDEWAARWRERLADEPASPNARREAMRAVNPAVIPRNHLVQAALDAAVSRRDVGPFEALLDALSRPYDDRPGLEPYTQPPEAGQRVYQTFCGT